MKALVVAIGLVLSSLLWSFTAHADEPSAAVQVELQNAMLKYTDSILIDGSYTYLDTKKDTISTVFPANSHPFVVTLGDNYFVCSEFIDDKGNTITADYLVQEIGGQFQVVQMIMNDRKSLKKAMKKFK